MFPLSSGTREGILIQFSTSDRKLEATGEGSKIYNFPDLKYFESTWWRVQPRGKTLALDVSVSVSVSVSVLMVVLVVQDFASIVDPV